MFNPIHGLQFIGIVLVPCAWLWFWGYMYVDKELPLPIVLAACYLPILFFIGAFLR